MFISAATEGDGDGMRGTERTTRRRNSLYVKQNRAYQMLMATLIIIFLIVTAVVVTSGGIKSGSTWKDNVLIRMIVERNSVRNTRGQ